MKARLNGIDTHYEVHGKEGAPWIVFSHSLACDLTMWQPQIEAFKDRYRLLAYDTRGHGASSAPGGAYSLDMLAEDARALMEHLKIRSAHFVGLSMGGMIGQLLCLKHPGLLERVVLADTSHGQTPEAQKQWEERIRTAETKGMAPLVESTLGRWFTEPFRASRKDVVERIAKIIASTPVAGYVGCCHAISKLDMTARLKEIRKPVLAIAGEQDGSAPGTRYIGENIPGAKLVMLQQAAHIANIEQAERFNQALREFLSGPASERA